MKRFAQVLISAMAVVVCLPLFIAMFREMRKRL